MSETGDTNYREEILKLVAKGKIKHTTKYVEKASDETLEKIYKSYVAKQLDEVNEQITTTLIKQLSDLMTSLELIEDGEELENDLENNELLKRDVKHMLCYVTPYVPLIGLVCGGICLGKHILKKRANQQNNQPKNSIFFSNMLFQLSHV